MEEDLSGYLEVPSCEDWDDRVMDRLIRLSGHICEWNGVPLHYPRWAEIWYGHSLPPHIDHHRYFSFGRFLDEQKKKVYRRKKYISKFVTLDGLIISTNPRYELIGKELLEFAAAHFELPANEYLVELERYFK